MHGKDGQTGLRTAIVFAGGGSFGAIQVGMMQALAAGWLETRLVSRERLADQMTTLLWEGFGHLHERR
jgi:hypothetical protein